MWLEWRPNSHVYFTVWIRFCWCFGSPNHGRIGYKITSKIRTPDVTRNASTTVSQYAGYGKGDLESSTWNQERLGKMQPTADIWTGDRAHLASMAVLAQELWMEVQSRVLRTVYKAS
jgi:hypothetical protein